ncbi:MAG: diaminopimelate decarboxylase, partial [Patescibacteria group bacterium]|nr:diaminopimelate decarboxylase [Patescibacteria group bacterium]
MKIKNNQIYLGKIKATELAEKYGTPLYVYDFDLVVFNIERLKKAFAKVRLKIKIYYAAKANSSIALLRFLKDKIEGIDAV